MRRRCGVGSALAKKLEPVAGYNIDTKGATGAVKKSPVYRVTGLRIGGVAFSDFEVASYDWLDDADLAIGREQLARMFDRD